MDDKNILQMTRPQTAREMFFLAVDGAFLVIEHVNTGRLFMPPFLCRSVGMAKEIGTVTVSNFLGDVLFQIEKSRVRLEQYRGLRGIPTLFLFTEEASQQAVSRLEQLIETSYSTKECTWFISTLSEILMESWPYRRDTEDESGDTLYAPKELRLPFMRLVGEMETVLVRLGYNLKKAAKGSPTIYGVE